MKTAILQCLKRFSSKNSKNVYRPNFKKVKITVQVNNTLRFMKTAILAVFAAVLTSKNSKNVYNPFYDQVFLKTLKLQLQNCTKRSF